LREPGSARACRSRLAPAIAARDEAAAPIRLGSTSPIESPRVLGVRSLHLHAVERLAEFRSARAPRQSRIRRYAPHADGLGIESQGDACDHSLDQSKQTRERRLRARRQAAVA